MTAAFTGVLLVGAAKDLSHSALPHAPTRPQKRRRVLAHLRAPEHDAVHFHRGPQGQPAPCFDGDCTSPRLSV
jgi:hypothetical protein